MNLIHQNGESAPRFTKLVELIKGCYTRSIFGGVEQNYLPCHWLKKWFVLYFFRYFFPSVCGRARWAVSGVVAPARLLGEAVCPPPPLAKTHARLVALRGRVPYSSGGALWNMLYTLVVVTFYNFALIFRHKNYINMASFIFNGKIRWEMLFMNNFWIENAWLSYYFKLKFIYSCGFIFLSVLLKFKILCTHSVSKRTPLRPKM